MNLTNINYFLAIAEESSISAAARKLYISQQSLSEHLRKLEAEVGTPLFHRGKTLSLTLAGECFYEGSKEILNAYRNMMSNIEDVTSKRESKLMLAIPTWCTPPYLSDFLVQFNARHPTYEVEIIKRPHDDIARSMDGVDLYLSYLPLSPELENCILLESDPYCATFHRTLAEKIYGDRWEAVEEQLAQTQDLSLLREMPFILLRDRNGHLVQDLCSIFHEYNFTPIIGLNSENCELNDKLCNNGRGCLLATESYVKHRFYDNKNLPTEEILSYPIRVTSFEPKMAISYKKGKRLRAVEICFIQESVAFFKKLGL